MLVRASGTNSLTIHDRATGVRVAIVRIATLSITALALSGGCGGGGPSLEESWGRAVTVGEGIVLYEPIAEIDSLPTFFAWRTATAASYSMALFDDAGTRIAVFHGLPAPSREVDAELGALVHPGSDYGWQVLAIDGSGAVIDGSPIGRFRLRSPVPADE
jgi:hypothetical protein